MPKAKSTPVKTKKTLVVSSPKPVRREIVAIQTTSPVPSKDRGHSVALLQPLLRDLIDLQLQVKLAHWNVRGAQFFFLHQLFDQVYGVVAGSVDSVAERIAQLGAVVEASIQQVATHSSLPHIRLSPAASVCLQGVVEGLSHTCHRIHTALPKFGNDPSSVDLLTKLLGDAEKQLWMLEAHLQPAHS